MGYANYIGINVNCLMKYHKNTQQNATKTQSEIPQKYSTKRHKNTQCNDCFRNKKAEFFMLKNMKNMLR